MRKEDEEILLRVFLGESDQSGERALYEEIVQNALDMGLAGTTVLRGLEGFGSSRRIHTARILQLSQDLPLVVEIVDREERIQEFLPVLDELLRDGLVTLEKVRTIRYREDPPEG